MSRVLGIDYSTKAIDLVFLDESSDAARWHSIPLARGTAGIRQIRHAYSWARELEEVYLVAIEDPMSVGRSAAKVLGRVDGAILSSIPERISSDQVWRLRPDEWRMACGLAGNCPKSDVAGWALERFPIISLWPQDAVDALAMAWAARDINAKAIAA